MMNFLRCRDLEKVWNDTPWEYLLVRTGRNTLGSRSSLFLLRMAGGGDVGMLARQKRLAHSARHPYKRRRQRLQMDRQTSAKGLGLTKPDGAPQFMPCGSGSWT
jgi:hypothetical protein